MSPDLGADAIRGSQTVWMDDARWRGWRKRRREAAQQRHADRRALDQEYPLLGTRQDGRSGSREIRLSQYQRQGGRDERLIATPVRLHLYGHGVALAPLGTEVEVGDFVTAPADDGKPARRWITEIVEVPADRIFSDPCMSGGMPAHLRISLSSRPPATSTEPTAPGVSRQAMEMAVDLARKCVGEAGRVSPKVGAVVERDGVILAGAFRGELKHGEHAEYTLLEGKLPSEQLAGATLYTTLEPCTDRSHPKIECVQRVIDRRIARVVIGVIDPNETIRGRGHLRLRDAGIEVALFDADLVPAIEELNRDFNRDHKVSTGLQRPPEQTIDPAPADAVGPNGYRLGYTATGDKVEWLPDPDDPAKELPMILRRGDAAILAMYNELWDKVAWNRHQTWRERVESGEVRLSDAQRGAFERGNKVAAQIEAKYGAESLGWDDFNWGLLSGRMSALAWVLGSQWNESLDT